MYFPFIAFIVVAVIVLIPIVISTQLFRISRRLQSQDGRLERIERDQKQILNAIKEKSLAEPVATVQPVTAASVSTSPVPAPPASQQSAKPVSVAASPVTVPVDIQPQQSVGTPQPSGADKSLTAAPSGIAVPGIKPEAKPNEKSPQTNKQPEPRGLVISDFERKSLDGLAKIWSWIVVGEGHRIKAVTAEYAIATTWLVRLGVIIFLCGSAFFLKYSIEHGLLPHSARVGLSVFAALLMLGFGMKITGPAKQFDLIGRGLLGGGILLLYFSVHAAANLYHLLPVPPAFGLMVLITAVALAISLRKDSLLVAILGIVGGTITPVIMNTGVKNLSGLFAYMLLLALGALFISRYRNWKLLNLLSFIATWTIYLMALDSYYDPKTDYAVAVTFLCIYFAVFFIQSIIFNIRNREPVSTIELLIIFAGTIMLFYKGWEMTLALYPRPYGAFFSLGAAAFFIAFIIYFLKRKYLDRNLLLIMFALSAFSITVTFPLLLSGKWITFSWSALAVIFLWLGLRLGSRFLSNCSFLIYFLALLRIITVDGSFRTVQQDYFAGMIERLITIGSVVAAFAAGRFLLRKYGEKTNRVIIPDDNDVKFGLPATIIAGVILWCGSFLLICYFTLEALRVSETFYLPLREPAVMLVWGAATAILAHNAARLKSVGLLLLTLVSGSILLTKLLIDIDVWNFRMNRIAYCSTPMWDYTCMRAIEFIALIALAFFCMNKLRFRQSVKLNSLMGIVSIGLLFMYLTLETSTLLINYVPEFRDGGISILWGAFAFTLIFRGLRRDNRYLRYAGLLLFSVDVIKIFMVDLSHLSQIYRIVAFTILGVVMICSAFIYMKFREQFKTENKGPIGSDKQPSQ